MTLRGVAKSFGATRVVEHLDLDVRDEEFMVLVGPSGCGKSTLLRLIAGLEETDEGTILIGEREVNDVAPKDRNIAMVFQNYALYPHMSVRDNLAFGLKMRKTPKAEVVRRVGETAEILGIAALLDRKPRQLSGGQRQRVAVGRAIVRNPDVFLFDEPLSNLDAQLRAEMRTEIARLQDRLRTTTIYVTHDQVEAMTMGDRIAVLHGGVLQQVGTPLDLYDRPANVFVAGFIGTPPMNLVPATIEAGRALLIGEVRLPMPEGLSGVAPGGTRVVVGIRPEHLTGAGASRADAVVFALRATAEVVEPLGHEVIVHGRLGETRLTGRLGAHEIPRVGETIELEVHVERVHVFDAATEKRIGG